MAAPKRKTAQGEHPLMSNRTLRAMVRSLASTHAHLSTRKHSQAAQADTACFVAPLADLVSMDVVFDCRPNGLLQHLRSGTHPPIPQPLSRLYAAIGAAMTAHGKPPLPSVVAFFERHEITGRGWPEALALAANLPLLLVVLPREKGRKDAIDLSKLARASNIPSIPVDAADAIALYRVAQESLGRARAGGGAAILEAVHLDSPPTIDKLAEYLVHRGIATHSWLTRNGSNLINSSVKRK